MRERERERKRERESTHTEAEGGERKSITFDIPIRTWLKIFQSILEPIALYGSEVWGPLMYKGFEKWDKHPVETLHAEFCKSILKVQRSSLPLTMHAGLN